MGAVDETFGAWFIGLQVASLLLGVSILQAWAFFSRARQDPVALKAVVLLLILLGVALSALASAGLYHFLVSSIGNPAALVEIPAYLNAEPFVNAANIAVVQCFYAFRLFRLTQSRILLGVVIFFSVAQFALGCAGAAPQMRQQGSIAASALQQALAGAALGADATCDAIITVAMVHFLRKHRTGMRSTQSLMNLLTNYTLASGFTTFAVSCVMLITWLAMPDTQIYSAISFVLPHLYTNSLLALLNARRALRRRSEAGAASTDPGDPMSHSLPLFTRPDEPGGVPSDFASTVMDIAPGTDSGRRHTVQFTELSDLSDRKYVSSPGPT